MIDFVRKNETITVFVLFGRQTRSIHNNITLKKKDPSFNDLVIENFKSVSESAEFNFK